MHRRVHKGTYKGIYGGTNGGTNRPSHIGTYGGEEICCEHVKVYTQGHEGHAGEPTEQYPDRKRYLERFRKGTADKPDPPDKDTW